jgi:hypothetical protein
MPAAPPIGFVEGNALLAAHTETLLGPRPPQRASHHGHGRPSRARLRTSASWSLMAWTACAWCAHDDAAAWSGMVANLRRARKELAHCRILMDLAGLKRAPGNRSASQIPDGNAAQRQGESSSRRVSGSLTPSSVPARRSGRCLSVVPPVGVDARAEAPDHWMRASGARSNSGRAAGGAGPARRRRTCVRGGPRASPPRPARSGRRATWSTPSSGRVARSALSH